MLRSTASSLSRRAVHPSRLSSSSLSWLRTSTGVSISSSSSSLLRHSVTPSQLTSIANMSSSAPSTPPHVSNLGNSSSNARDKTFAVRHPSSPDVIVHTVQASTAADVSTAISAASAAQKAWARTPLDARRGIFLRAAQLLESGEGEWVKRVCEANKQETPCTDAWAALQIGWMGPQLRQLAASVGEALRMEVHEVGDGTSVMIERAPFGVCFSSAPWNAAIALTNRCVVAPLLAGNAVILKTSEHTPLTQRLWCEMLYAAGLPEGVLQVLHVDPKDAPEIVEQIVSDKRVRHVNFTGSTRVGSIMAQMAGKHLKPTIMELGGKAPSVVLEDADLDLAANNIIFGALLNQGQICMSTERVIIPSTVHDAFVDSLRKQSAALAGKQFGLFTSASGERYRSLLADTVQAGATDVLATDKQAEGASGNAAPASIVTGVKREHKLWTEESFAPTIVVMAVDVAGKSQEQVDREMVELANDTPYGLSASVWGKDIARATEVAKGIESGAVHINSLTPADPEQVPHGGWKSSGWGRFNSVEGIRGFTQTRAIEVCTKPHPYPIEIL